MDFGKTQMSNWKNDTRRAADGQTEVKVKIVIKISKSLLPILAMTTWSKRLLVAFELLVKWIVSCENVH